MSDEVTATSSEQRVGWLELFFDLVFVVVIEQLTHRLHGHPTASDFAQVAGFSLLIWACWTNVTSFANVAGGVTRRGRVLVLIAMAGVALLAIAMPEVTGDRAGLFALGYAITRLAMWPLWLKGLRTNGISFVRPTIFGPGLALAWLLSIAVPEPARWWLWGALALVEAGLLSTMGSHIRFNMGHLIERVGLFIMIVLGESVVQLIRAVDLHMTTASWFVAALSFVLVCTFWWMYFDLGSNTAERYMTGTSYGVIRDVLLAGHWLVILGLIYLAAGLGGAIESADESHLDRGLLVALCGGAWLYHLAFVFISFRYGYRVRYILPWAIPSLTIPLAIIVLGTEWVPWLVVLALLAETLLHGFLGAVYVRRADQEHTGRSIDAPQPGPTPSP